MTSLLSRPFSVQPWSSPAVIEAGRTPDPKAPPNPTASWTYQELIHSADHWRRVLQSYGVGAGDRVCALLPPGFSYVAIQWGTWASGAVWVPMALSHPLPELEYVLGDADPALLIVQDGASPWVAPLHALATDRGLRTIESSRPDEGLPIVLRQADEAAPSPLASVDRLGHVPPTRPAAEDFLAEVHPDRGCMMIYTSGTTGRAKGVLTTHHNLSAQVENLVEIWDWQSTDRILHVLPLHHVHGVVNALSCALWVGAACEFSAFEPETVWERFASGEITVFMAVPTIYHHLIAAWNEADKATRSRWSKGAGRLRLMISGSAALPVAVLEQWRDITGQTLLERYGMSEIGMGLSNPLHGERRPGHVGQPLPGMEVRIVDQDGEVVAPGESGQIQVRGDQVFKEYWRQPKATSEAFTEGWFKTGDEGLLVDGYYRILGRSSVDILKTGGYKVSALEIEDVLREHPQVSDAAVVGVVDPAWGQRICAAIIAAGQAPDLEEFGLWMRQRLASYKVPRTVRVLPDLPRNAMGKVQKPAVAALFEPN